MKAFKNILLIVNVIQLGLFVAAFAVCLILLDFNAEKEDFWGVILLLFFSLYSAIISFLNLSNLLRWFKKIFLSLNPGNFIASLLYLFVAIIGLADASSVSREMLLAFIPALVFLFTGVLLKTLESKFPANT